MTDINWVEIDTRLPPEGVTVLTKINDETGERNVQILVRRGGLWFTNESGDAMYVYYRPTHWASRVTPLADNHDRRMAESESG